MSGKTVLGRYDLAQGNVKFLIIGDGMFNLVLIQHRLDYGPMSLTLTQLPMCFGRNDGRMDVLALKKFGKLFTTKFTGAICHYSLGWSCPLYPMLMDQLNHSLGISLMSPYGNMEIGPTVKNMIEVMLGSLG